MIRVEVRRVYLALAWTLVATAIGTCGRHEETACRAVDGANDLVEPELPRDVGPEVVEAVPLDLSPDAPPRDANDAAPIDVGTEADASPAVEPCDDGNDLPWDGCTGGLFTEFRVNLYRERPLTSPVAVVAPDGGLSVAWCRGAKTGRASQVVARRFEPNGRLGGTEVQVSTGDDAADEPALAFSAANDTLGVTWRKRTLGAGGWWAGPSSVRARLLQGIGLSGPPATEVAVSIAEEGLNPAAPTLAALADGRFVVVWAAGSAKIRGQLLGADGIRTGGAFTVTPHATGWEANGGSPAVGAAADGSFVVAWEARDLGDGAEGGPDADGFGIYVQRYRADGTPRDGNRRANLETAGNQERPALAVRADGSFLAAWKSCPAPSEDGWSLDETEGPCRMVAALFDANGDVLAGELSLRSPTTDALSGVHLAPLAGGGIVAAWVQADADAPSMSSVRVQVIRSDGTLAGTDLPANRASGWHHSAAVAATPDGGFVVVWLRRSADGTGDDVMAQRFDGTGHRRYR